MKGVSSPLDALSIALNIKLFSRNVIHIWMGQISIHFRISEEDPNEILKQNIDS